MKNTTKNMPLWQQQTKIFFDKNYGWILLITGLLAFVLIVDVKSILGDFVKGFHDGMAGNAKSNYDNIGEEPSLIKDIIGVSFVLLFATIIIGFVVQLVGELFYHLFFKFILQKSNKLYIISAIIWLMFFYNLLWEVWNWIYVKNNAFEQHFASISNKVSSKIYLDFITDYRENYSTLSTALILLCIIAYGLIKNYTQNAKTQAQLIAQKSQAELTALKAQINPHFLFNVLNNLYGSAIIEESPKTSEGILQLSSIMRHVVEGTKNEKIEVEKEIRFLHDFIELNKMRVPNRPNIRIETDIYWDENPAQIAPLLVIPYIENAFKYGISINEESFIEMNFRVENQQLHFVCKNSIIKLNDKLEVGTGTGLENTKRRLDLYYPGGYQLATNSSDNVFTVSLIVNL